MLTMSGRTGLRLLVLFCVVASLQFVASAQQPESFSDIVISSVSGCVDQAAVTVNCSVVHHHTAHTDSERLPRHESTWYNQPWSLNLEAHGSTTTPTSQTTSALAGLAATPPTTACYVNMSLPAPTILTSPRQLISAVVH